MIVWCVIFCCIVLINLLPRIWMFIYLEINALMYLWKVPKRRKYIIFCWRPCLNYVQLFAKFTWLQNCMVSITCTCANLGTCLIYFLLFLHAVCMHYGLSACRAFCLIFETLYVQYDIHTCQSGNMFNLLSPVSFAVFNIVDYQHVELYVLSLLTFYSQCDIHMCQSGNMFI
jgi:hypothetical protein